MMYSPALGAACDSAAICSYALNSLVLRSGPRSRRHSSANQYIDRHAAKAASSAGQLNGCTTLGAATSNATVAPIFTISQTMTPTADTAGDTLENRLVMP